MNLSVNSKSNTPIYEQIYNQIVSGILAGEILADFCLPSIRVVASQLGVSIITIKKAWEMLEANKFIYTKAGKGCFVASSAPKFRDNKKLELARAKIRERLPYYKDLGFTLEELIKLMEEEYK